MTLDELIQIAEDFLEKKKLYQEGKLQIKNDMSEDAWENWIDKCNS